MPGGDARTSRRRVGIVIGVAAEALLVLGLSLAAWGPEDSYHPPLTSWDEIQGVLVVMAIVSVLIIAGAAAIAGSRRSFGPVVGTILLLIAGFLGFLSVLVAAASRCDTCDDA